MGAISISFLVASVVYVLIRPPPWMPLWFIRWHQGQIASGQADRGQRTTGTDSDATTPRIAVQDSDQDSSKTTIPIGRHTSSDTQRTASDAVMMPPPPLPKVTSPPVLVEPVEETTPKAKPSTPATDIPAFSIDSANSSNSTSSLSSPALSMPPPPRPSVNKLPPPDKQHGARIPTLGQFPAVNSIQRARGPVPSRAPAAASSSLTPPPTISTKPQKPSRKVLLEPGHSPLDWASISGPNADLRGVPPETPYMRVTPSMLKEKTGRKGKDAWMAINGKVYNVTPYAKFHPGGVPELMRAAGRDGTKLFWEIHPWVNYETMLAACLVGLMVDEPEGSGPSKMDEMD